MQRNYLDALGLYTCVIAFAFTFSACTAERTQTGRMPDVDLDVDAGRLPAYDIRWADVDVGTQQRTVTVPKIQVTREQETITVPYISINPPGAKDVEDRTVIVELEVPDSSYSVQIQEVRAVGNQLWVISELRQRGGETGGASRVSDRVVIRAPEDLDVRKVIVGQRPESVYNQQYNFFDNQAALEAKIPDGGRKIYSRSA